MKKNEHYKLPREVKTIIKEAWNQGESCKEVAKLVRDSGYKHPKGLMITDSIVASWAKYKCGCKPRFKCRAGRTIKRPHKAKKVQVEGDVSTVIAEIATYPGLSEKAKLVIIKSMI